MSDSLLLLSQPPIQCVYSGFLDFFSYYFLFFLGDKFATLFLRCRHTTTNFESLRETNWFPSCSHDPFSFFFFGAPLKFLPKIEMKTAANDDEGLLTFLKANTPSNNTEGERWQCLD